MEILMQIAEYYPAVFGICVELVTHRRNARVHKITEFYLDNYVLHRKTCKIKLLSVDLSFTDITDVSDLAGILTVNLTGTLVKDIRPLAGAHTQYCCATPASSTFVHLRAYTRWIYHTREYIMLVRLKEFIQLI